MLVGVILPGSRGNLRRCPRCNKPYSYIERENRLADVVDWCSAICHVSFRLRVALLAVSMDLRQAIDFDVI